MKMLLARFRSCSGTFPWSRIVSRAPYGTSSTDKMLQVTRERLGRYTIAWMSVNRPPVNSFNMPLSLELSSQFHQLTQSDHIHAIILKSSLSNVFSAGLDFKEMYGVSEQHLREFWRVVREMWYRIYTSRLPTLAAINGHCLAGGTLIAAACDYRICTHGDYKIGVTAAKIGLVPPHWFLKTLTYLMGQTSTERLLQRGQVFPPDQALKLGLVDDTCKAEDLDEQCKKALLPYLETCHDTRTAIKLALRQELIDSYHQLEEEDTEKFVQFTLRESTQKTLASMSAST